MFEKTNQKQDSGDNSQNIQVAGNLIIGITEASAREIALDIYRENFIKLATEAKEIAFNRVEELVEDFLGKLHERNPESLDSLKDPGMQVSLFNAQKEYAKTGDKNLEETLVDMLVDRASIKERNLKQIVLDESIITVSKLTTEQIDILTLVFLLTRTINNKIVSIPTLKKYFIEYLFPFISSLTNEESTYEHLVYSGCSSFMSISYDDKLETILRNRYKALFLKGFTKEEFENSIGEMEKYKDLIIPCFHDLSKFQLNTMDEKKLESKALAKGIDAAIISRLNQSYTTYLMTPEESKDFILDQTPELEQLLKVWATSNMNSTSLTSVGIAIAHANFRRKTGLSLDLGIWIK